MNISSLQKEYPLVEDINEEDLDPNSSLKKMLTLIGKKKYVIDFGCATGYFARLLTKRECQVVGVEINSQAAKVAEQYCESVIIADLDYVSLSEILPNVKFDIAVFGDVLEHLRDPWRVLKEVHSLLKPQGYVIASIPNIAHGSIRLALLQGKFDYAELGILDNTHLRFFTRETSENMFEETGYCVHTLERTKLPIFSGSNWIPLIDKNKFNNHVIEQVEQDEEADTFQFIIKAVPSSIENKYILLKEKYSKLTNYYSDLVIDLENLKMQSNITQRELQQSQLKLQELKESSESMQYQLQAQINSLQNALEEKQNELIETTLYVQKTQSELKDLKINLQNHEEQNIYYQNMIKAMESSKFWKIRQSWIAFKKFMRFNPCNH